MTDNEKKNRKVRAERHKVELPMAFSPDQESVSLAKTIDLSGSGIAFESDSFQSVGGHIDFVISIVIDHHPVTLKCKAEIIRVEDKDTKHLIAAKVLESFIEE